MSSDCYCSVAFPNAAMGAVCDCSMIILTYVYGYPNEGHQSPLHTNSSHMTILADKFITKQFLDLLINHFKRYFICFPLHLPCLETK